MEKNNNRKNLKVFFIKVITITFSIIIVINVTYNLILADKLENLNKLLKINNKENIEIVKNKIRAEIKKGLEKENIMNEEDKVLFYKFFKKIEKEFSEVTN